MPHHSVRPRRAVGRDRRFDGAPKQLGEAEQKRHEDEAQARREQAERERAERTRVEKLLADADAWRRMDALRGFIGAVEHLASVKNVNSGEGTELAAWLKWARQQAEAIDPVVTTLDRLTNKSAG